MIDAIDQLVSLYGNQDDFVKAFIERTLFLPVEVVEARNNEMIELYKSGGKFPIRFSPAHRKVWKVRNKDEAVKFTRHHDARLPLYPSFNVSVDPDGNYEIRRQIKLKLNQSVSIGRNSTVKNYTISHVWGLASHPVFFSALWNIVLIPAHFNYLMDKDPESHEVVRMVKEAVERQCIVLYRPYESLVEHIPEVEEFKGLLSSDTIIQETAEYNIHFLTEEGVAREQKALFITADERELIETLLNRMGQKFFIDYYQAYLTGEDLMNVIPVGVYTYNSVRTRMSTMRRIFREGLHVKALAYIVGNQSSKLDEELINQARELMELA